MAFAVRLIVLCRFPMQWAETNYRVYLMHSFCKYFLQLLVKKQMESTKGYRLI